MHGYLRHLANFAHVIEAGSISAAANQLGTSASTISGSVKMLEARLGETLLERRRSGVVPTGRGQTLYKEAREIVGALDRALGSDAQHPGATLRISLPGELAQGWFDTALARLQAERPDLNLVLMLEDSLVDHTKFARDLHVRVGRPEARPGMTDLTSARTRALMVAHEALCRDLSVDDPDAIGALPFIARPRASGMVDMRLGDGRVVQFSRTLQVSSIAARIALARAGLGVTTCLDRSVATDLQQGRLRRVLPTLFDHPVSITIASPHKRPPQAAIDVASALARDIA